MKPYKPPSHAVTQAHYAACRHGGSPPGIVAVELELPTETAAELERLFQRRPGQSGDAMKPRFARHAAHVAAVMGEGGYPVLSAESTTRRSR